MKGRAYALIAMALMACGLQAGNRASVKPGQTKTSAAAKNAARRQPAAGKATPAQKKAPATQAPAQTITKPNVAIDENDLLLAPAVAQPVTPAPTTSQEAMPPMRQLERIAPAAQPQAPELKQEVLQPLVIKDEAAQEDLVIIPIAELKETGAQREASHFEQAVTAKSKPSAKEKAIEILKMGDPRKYPQYWNKLNPKQKRDALIAVAAGLTIGVIAIGTVTTLAVIGVKASKNAKQKKQEMTEEPMTQNNEINFKNVPARKLRKSTMDNNNNNNNVDTSNQNQLPSNFTFGSTGSGPSTHTYNFVPENFSDLNNQQSNSANPSSNTQNSSGYYDEETSEHIKPFDFNAVNQSWNNTQGSQYIQNNQNTANSTQSRPYSMYEDAYKNQGKYNLSNTNFNHPQYNNMRATNSSVPGNPPGASTTQTLSQASEFSYDPNTAWGSSGSRQ